MPLPQGLHELSANVRVHVFDAELPGPTALVQGGIHGDEVAGVHALEELLELGLRPTRGRLLVVPVMNPAAYRAGTRTALPHHDWAGLDLNRQFPGDVGAPERERRLAGHFMALVTEERPRLMLTLHESQKRFHPEVRPSFGQTLVYGVEPVPPIIGRVVEGLNERRQSEDEHWSPHLYPVATSSTEVIVDAIGCVGVCVETWMGFALARRVAMHCDVVRLFLRELDMIDDRAFGEGEGV